VIGFWHDVFNSLGVMSALAYWAVVLLTALTIVLVAFGLAAVFLAMAIALVGGAWNEIRGNSPSTGEDGKSDQTAEVVQLH
jgi:uncharacterized membrane protein YhaH (DUF805 family)